VAARRAGVGHLSAMAMGVALGVVSFASPGVGQVCQEWSQALNGRNVTAVKMLADGSALIAAETSLLGANGVDITLRRIAASGSLMWEFVYDGPSHSNDNFGDLALGANDRCYISGTQIGGVFVLAIDPDGSLAWESSVVGSSVAVSGPGSSRLPIVVDATGAVTVGGRVAGGSTSSGDDALIARFAPDGTLVWARQLHLGLATADSRTSGLALAPNGTVYVAGDFGFGQFQTHFFLAAYDPNGALQWTVTEGGPISAVFAGAMVAADASSNAFLIGETESTCGLFQHRVIKVTPAGVTVWNEVLSSVNCSMNQLWDVGVTPGGDIIVAGYGTGTQFGTSSDYVTSRFDGTDGSIVWSRNAGGSGGSSDLLTDLAVDAVGRCYVTGITNLSGSSAQQMTTVGYDVDGTELWRHDQPSVALRAYLDVGTDGEIVLASGSVFSGGVVQRFRALAGSFSTFGVGCSGSNGVPSHVGAGSPTLGSSISHDLTLGPASGFGFLVLGLSDTSLFGTQLPIDLGSLGAPGCSAYCSHDAVIGPIALSPSGAASQPMSVPTPCQLVGLRLYSQYMLLDPPANPLGLTASNGVTMRIGN